ncbi:MAG: carbohydrate ABC transporter permease [Chloroflexota bacterium]
MLQAGSRMPQSGAALRKSRRPISPGSAARLIVLVVLAIVFLAPLVWLFLVAIKTLGELAAVPIRILPENPQWHNFHDALTVFPWLTYAWHSLFLSSIFGALTVCSSALVGFGFARLRGFGKNFLFLLMLSTVMLPAIATLIPTYIIFSKIGLVYTYWPWVLWGLGSSPFFSFLFRQFFASIPVELEEAALLDGCGYSRIFWQVFLPLSKAVMAVVFLLSFQGVWSDFITPQLLLDIDGTTLAVGVATGYVDPTGTTVPNLMAAGALLYALPVVVLFIVLQRFLVQGIVTTGLKG